MSKAIDHCELVRQIQAAKMQEGDVMEAVMTRVGQLTREAFTDADRSPRHDLPGIELMAVAIAIAGSGSVVWNGAAKTAADFDMSLSRMAEQAGGQHISFC